ncbi:integral membrane protein [Penicillium brasilianum]|uniref:Integral membrane protein n=1 Tax=Penicillium brasilianum TaxID=104259 RepID=A0A1S9RVY5_PENBI|nr:integral membrane protein [Penicillium brasilianum]
MSDAEQVASMDQVLASGFGNATVGISMIVFMAIALYNALELSVLIPLSFHSYRSLYFWALLTSAVLGVIPQTIGQGLQYFNRAPLWLSMFLSNFGFIFLVPNQSIVLYSRLHLVSQNQIVLAFVRWLIVFCYVAIAIPTVTLNIGSTYVPESAGWVDGFDAMERIQVIWFAAQEVFISTIYIVDTIRLIRLNPELDARRHKILYELLAINIAAILMDLSIVILQHLGLYFTQIELKPMLYSIKLKLEFAVLGMLVSLVHSHSSNSHSWEADCTTSGFS